MFKIIVLSTCLVSIALAHSDDGWDWDSKYKFEYGVKDPHTGDHKSQWEISDDKHGLKGGYTLDEPDGTKRVVQYKADKWNGFQAIVKRIGHAVHPQTYGAPFVVKQEQDQHSAGGYQKQQQQQLGQDSYGQSFNGVGFWKQPQQQQQNGWVDQQPASSSNVINGNNGWKNEGGMFATSYANQKIYH